VRGASGQLVPVLRGTRYNYPGLTLQDLQAVANYYEHKGEEIELWLAENE
jgi:hypothetical protein